MADRLTAALEVYLAHLAVERGLAPHTLAAYRRDLTRYVEHLRASGRTEPAQITERDVEDYVLVLRTGSDGRAVLSPSSAARSVVAMRGWHRFLALDGLAPTDAAAEVRPPAQPRRLPKAISVEDVGRLIDAAGWLEGEIGRRLPSALLRAGPFPA